MAGIHVTDKGYTGHEHLSPFGDDNDSGFCLINMNGRVYDPVLARFLFPDPYVQAPDFTQSFNRYTYCLNNPFKYTDPSGEVWHIVIGAVVGGVVNLVVNWDNIDGFWQGFAAVAVGAGSGALTAATGGAGAWAVMGVGAVTGAMTAGTNNVIAQTDKNFAGMGNVDWGQVGISSVIGGVSGAAGSGAGYAASNMNFLVNGVNSPVLRSAIVSPLASGAGHIAGGTTANLISGQKLGNAFYNSFDGVGQSMAIGTAIGVSATVGVSFAKGVSPINGRMMWPKNDGFQGNPEYAMLPKGTMLDRYGDDTGQFVAPQGTPFDQRALPPSYVNKPLNVYEVTQPLPVLQGTTAPSFWFNSGGGGTQYMLPIQYYLNNGYLIRVR